MCNQKTSIKTLLACFALSSIILFAVLSPKITGFFSGSANGEKAVKTATFAICEKTGSYIICRDKFFASCNGSPFEINADSFECNNKTHAFPNRSLSEHYYPLNWTDPRPSNFLTAWAVSE
jgi:hypothetical protein